MYKQLELPLNQEEKKKPLTIVGVFNLIKSGNFGQRAFLAWLKERELKAFNKGYAQGKIDGTPKERYQGEFGARSNY